MILVFAGCSLLDPAGPGGESPFLFSTDVSGELSGDVEWDGNGWCYRVIDATEVVCGATLRICDGASIIIEPGASLVVKGKIEIEGDDAAPVSISASSGSVPMPGLTVEGPCSRCSIRHCLFTGFDIGILAVGTDSLDVSSCEFSGIRGEGIRAEFSFARIDSSRFTGCGSGIRNLESRLVLSECVIDSCSSYGYRGFNGSDTLRSCLFEENGIAALYIDQGNVFMSACSLLAGTRSVILRNSVKGAIDGCSFSGGRQGIYCHAQELNLNNCRFYGVSDEAISCFSSGAFITGSVFDSCGTAIGCYEGSDAVVTGNSITGCSGVGIYISNSSPSITANNLIGSRRSLVECKGRSAPVEASGNWWGDPCGPYHRVHNPDGPGSPVGDFVQFSPWAAQSF